MAELKVEATTCSCLQLMFRQGDQVVGRAQLHWTDDTVVEVVDIEVVAAYRGRGLGRRILSYCLDIARRQGARMVTAHTSPTNGPAYRLFISGGFRPVHEEEHMELTLS